MKLTVTVPLLSHNVIDLRNKKRREFHLGCKEYRDQIPGEDESGVLVYANLLNNAAATMHIESTLSPPRCKRARIQ